MKYKSRRLVSDGFCISWQDQAGGSAVSKFLREAYDMLLDSI